MQRDVDFIDGNHKAVWDVTVKVPPPAWIVGSWSGTWLSETAYEGGTISMVISGSGENMTMFVSWTRGGQAYSGWSDYTGRISVSPAGTTPRSGASSRVWFQKPGDPHSFWFYRYFSLGTRDGMNTAEGNSSSGDSFNDSWTITMTRNQP